MRTSLSLITPLAALASCAAPSAGTLVPAVGFPVPPAAVSASPAEQTGTPLATAGTTSATSALMLAPRQGSEPVIDEIYGPTEDNLLLSLAGSWSRQTFQLADSEQETTQLSFGLSYFLSRTHEFGLTFGSQFIDSSSSFADGMGGVTTVNTKGETIFVNAIYNFNIYLSPRTGVYFGPSLGWGRFDSGVEATSEPQYGARIGLRHWLHPRVAITLEPQYTFVKFEDNVGGESDFYQVLLGLAATL